MNRIKVIVGGIALMACQMVSAQRIEAYGMKAGYLNSNFSKMKMLGTEIKTNPKHSFYAGFFYESNFAEKFSVSFDLLYSQMGANIETPFANGEFSFHRGTMPISLKFYATYDLGLYVGAYMTYDFGYKFDLTPNNTNSNNVSFVDFNKKLPNYLDEKMKFTDYGVRFGLDYQIVNKLNVEAFYYLGMNNMVKKDTNDEIKMNYITAGLSYEF